MKKRKIYRKPQLTSQKVFTATEGCTATQFYSLCIERKKRNLPPVPRT
jgi:hypothetical protein